VSDAAQVQIGDMLTRLDGAYGSVKELVDRAEAIAGRPWADSSPDSWKLYAMRLGPDTFKEPKLMFEGSFKDAHDFMDFLENMPMNTPGMEAISQVQNPQPFKCKLVGPLVTMVMTNKRKCLSLAINA
jgi:hypothetical protein